MLLLRAFEREVAVYSRLWRASVFSAFVHPLLFLGAMGIGLGELVDDGTGDVGGVPYLQFVAPGLMVANVLLTIGGEALWPVMAGFKWEGQFRAMVATALGPGDIFGGYVLWLGLRAGVAAVAYLAAATVVGALASPWAAAAVIPAVLLALATAAPLAAFAVGQDSDAAFSLIMRLYVLPSFLLAGTFFPVSDLPVGARVVAWSSPLFHAVEASRALCTGRADLAVVGHCLFLVAVVAVAWPRGVRGFTRRLTP